MRQALDAAEGEVLPALRGSRASALSARPPWTCVVPFGALGRPRGCERAARLRPGRGSVVGRHAPGGGCDGLGCTRPAVRAGDAEAGGAREQAEWLVVLSTPTWCPRPTCLDRYFLAPPPETHRDPGRRRGGRAGPPMPAIGGRYGYLRGRMSQENT